LLPFPIVVDVANFVRGMFVLIFPFS